MSSGSLGHLIVEDLHGGIKSHRNAPGTEASLTKRIVSSAWKIYYTGGQREVGMPTLQRTSSSVLVTERPYVIDIMSREAVLRHLVGVTVYSKGHHLVENTQSNMEKQLPWRSKEFLAKQYGQILLNAVILLHASWAQRMVR